MSDTGNGRYADDAPVEIGGHKGRVICAANRTDPKRLSALGALPPSDPVTAGADDHGPFFRFEVMDGDLSANEAAQYKGRENAAPKRAMMSFESVGNIDRYGQRITQRFGILVRPGPVLRENLFCVLAQENAAPRNNVSWRSPPMEFGLMVKGRTTKRADGRTVGVIDRATRRPYADEYFYLKAHVLGNGGKPIDVGRILSDEPVRRGRFYSDIRIVFIDGRGRRGRLELWIDGRQQGRTYVGPTGYADFRSVYPAFGVYQHIRQTPLAARFYGWKEEAQDA